MLDDLRKYDCLGTPNFFFELFTTLKSSSTGKWQRNDLEKLFYNRVIDNRPIIDGGIELAIKIQIIKCSQSNFYINKEFIDFIKNKNLMINKFNEFLFKTLKNDEIFHNIFSSENLTHDIIYKKLQINNSAFGFKFSNFKQLLLDFKILEQHPEKEFKSYILNNQYKSLFDETILPEIRKRKIGVEEFKKNMELQELYGEQAEKFVLNYEHKRLKEKKKVDWVAEYIVNEGYDIASYDTINDKLPNRFIEVKSYDGHKPYFFWSQNEFKKAKLKGNQYWLYLINRSKIETEGYIPEKHQNPYNSILKDKNSEWIKEVDKYKITAYKK